MNGHSITRAINSLHPDAKERLLQLAQTQMAIQNLKGQQHSASSLYLLAKLEGRSSAGISGEHHQRRNGRCIIVSGHS